MKVALGQFQATRNKSENLERIKELTQDARQKDADLVVYPEAAMYHLGLDESLVEAGEPLDGPFVSALSRLARSSRIILVAGIFESIEDHDRVYNTTVVIDADGSLLGTYRKIHLFDAFGYRESDYVEPGDGQVLVCQTGDLATGFMTCYDLRFPELARHVAMRGAKMIVLPAAWTHGLLKEEHWDVLVRARAIENTVYVAAADQVGAGTAGRSMLVDPMGIRIAATGEQEHVIVGTVSSERLATVRSTLPTLSHIRNDVYAQWQAARS
jgi:deaminated glutathione amidase